MSPHVRVLLFCCALLMAPALYALGDHLAGSPAGIAGAGAVVLASYVWTRLAPQVPESPAGVTTGAAPPAAPTASPAAPTLAAPARPSPTLPPASEPPLAS